MTRIEQLIRRFYADLWENGHIDQAPEILHEDLVFRGSLGDEKRGIDGYLDYLQMVRNALDDYRCDILSLVCEPEHAAAKMRFHGEHNQPFMGFAPTGRRVGWNGAAFFEMRDDRLADIWVLGDTDGLRKALGGTE